MKYCRVKYCCVNYGQDFTCVLCKKTFVYLDFVGDKQIGQKHKFVFEHITKYQIFTFIYAIRDTRVSLRFVYNILYAMRQPPIYKRATCRTSLALHVSNY